VVGRQPEPHQYHTLGNQESYDNAWQAWLRGGIALFKHVPVTVALEIVSTNLQAKAGVGPSNGEFPHRHMTSVRNGGPGVTWSMKSVDQFTLMTARPTRFSIGRNNAIFSEENPLGPTSLIGTFPSQ